MQHSTPSRSGKCFWAPRFNAAALGCVLAALSPALAHGTVTVTPANGGTLVNKTVYYAGSPTGALVTGSQAFMDPDPYFRFFDTDEYRAANSAATNQAMYFDVVSDTTFTLGAGETLVLVVEVAQGTGSAGTKPAAIYSVNGTECNSSLCLDQRLFGDAVDDYYFAVPYTQKTTVRIGIIPAEVCYSYYVVAGQLAQYASGCSSATSIDPDANTAEVATMQLSFAFKVIKSGESQASGSALDKADLSLSFQEDGPALSCPSTQDVYFPGDEEILVNTDVFGMVSEGEATLLVGRAPRSKLYVVGAQGSDPTITKAGLLGNEVHSTVDFGGNRSAGGFRNSTNETSLPYNVEFLVRDAAGLIGRSNGSPCIVRGVETSAIQGFLGKSNCFIATAAFRSIDAGPVAMLRDFRDRVLMPTRSGRAFVSWYYSWSPGAAEWLMENPEFRFPVLLALVPVQVAAWLLLHPLWLGALFAIGLAILLRFSRGFTRGSKGGLA